MISLKFYQNRITLFLFFAFIELRPKINFFLRFLSGFYCSGVSWGPHFDNTSRHPFSSSMDSYLEANFGKFQLIKIGIKISGDVDGSLSSSMVFFLMKCF